MTSSNRSSLRVLQPPVFTETDEINLDPPKTVSLAITDDSSVIKIDQNSINKVNLGKFWGFATLVFFLPFFLIFGILGGVNPPIAQQTDNLGQPNGQRDWLKIAGASAVTGIIALIIFVIVVMGSPGRFENTTPVTVLKI